MKFSKPFKGATGDNTFPQDFKVGDDCPSDLEDAARAMDALEPEKPAKAKSKE